MISSCTLSLRILFGRTMQLVTTTSSSTVTASPAREKRHSRFAHVLKLC
uniref:Uncharacterized protein n=1 Tax=Rhizophora mucronata TaxID=61149 RepID=A0A2P2KZD2_RHIMU